MPSGLKEKVFPQINDIYVIVEELDDRIERLKRECPIQWEPDKIELKTKWEDVWKNVSPGDIGGSSLEL